MKKLITLYFVAVFTVVIAADFKLPEDLSVLDMKTASTPTGKSFQFCWIVRECPDCVQPYNIQIRKYLAEGGQYFQGPFVHKDDWVQANTDKPEEDPRYCITETVPSVGHWIYEALMCGPNPNGGDPICSEFTSLDSANSVLPAPGTDERTSWWIYGYLKAPGPIEL
jgi:hypothetical protein